MAAHLPSFDADISWHLMFSPFRENGIAMSFSVEEKTRDGIHMSVPKGLYTARLVR